MKRITRDGEVAIATNFDSAGPAYGGMIVPDAIVPALYPFRLNVYMIPPDYDISIEQFEEYAFARLQLLRALEHASMRFQREDELFKAIKPVEDKWMPLHSNESALTFDLFKERQKDQASHFILRLAFCNNPDNIRWFVTQECLLFRLRFTNEMSKERIDFLRQTNSSLIPIDLEEKRKVVEELKKCSPGKELDDFYRVPFEHVPDLMSRRAVLLKKGWAYVPRSDSFSIIMTRFKENLEFWMERTARELPSIRDERIMPLLQLVKITDSTSTSDTSRGFVEGKLTANDLDAGIGLPLEEAVMFWRKLFAPKCGEDGFSKNYLYNVRHNYGQEGKRANYGPTPCSKIITGTAPGVGECHGCPFRHSSSESLATLLSTYHDPNGVRLNGSQIHEILEMAQSNHCQTACTRLFEYTRRPGQPTNQIETFAYPTKFFEASVKLTRK